MARKQFVVWLRFNTQAAARHQETAGVWQTNGDGPMGRNTAERVAKEVAQSFGIQARALPVGESPT